MAIALISLAILQYKWLGTVSDTEKERLEESLSASSENFVSDFNDVFHQLSSAFRVQVSSPSYDINGVLSDSYFNWINNSPHPEIIDSVYVIKKAEDEPLELFLFDKESLNLKPISITSDIQQWIDKDSQLSRFNINGTSLRVSPFFGNPTFIANPVQLLDMIQVIKPEIGQNVNVQLSIDQLDDIVLIKLNDSYIKEQIIPAIARVYFSESYDDQYSLSLVKLSVGSEYDFSTSLQEIEYEDVYYSSIATDELTQPDFSTSLDRFSFSNILVYKSETSPFSQNNSISLSRSDSMLFRFQEKIISSEQIDTVAIDNHATTAISHIFSNNSLRSSDDSSSWQMQSDTTITSSLTGALRGSSWHLWLSFKQGSLETFVNKTRIRNLGISFGILSILGISVVFIVVFAQRSRELSEQQMLFVAGVSHELRTPITVIRSAAENLKEGVVQDEERRQQYASLMLKEGRRLSDMVDQIMEFSGIQTGKRVYHFKDVDIAELFDSVKEESLHLLDDKGMHLEYSINSKQTTIYADPDAIFLSITNLINNAIKFSGSSKKVLLKVDDIQLKAKPALRIQVQDFGIGIPEKEQNSVFKPFFRGEKSVNDQVKGNGIGLSLVQKVAVAHKGEISLKSKEGEGSIFSLILALEHHK